MKGACNKRRELILDGIDADELAHAPLNRLTSRECWRGFLWASRIAGSTSSL